MAMADPLSTSFEDVVRALKRLPATRLDLVLQFVEFVEFQAEEDSGEDETAALWAAVEANAAFQGSHPDEPAETFESGAEFLRAVHDL